MPRRARRSPRRRFDGGAARDRHGRRVQGRAASVGAPLREGDPRAPSRAAPGFLARRQARASVGRGAARGRGAVALNRSTHGGAVVFKLTGEGPRYLLVEAAGTRDRWVFPKGHVEKGETAAATALREVTEEAGVRARPIRRLRRVEQKQEGERISIAYFLMAYAGRATPLEKRRTRWLSFDEAIEALDLVKSRRLLRSADRLISLGTAEKPTRNRIRRALARFAGWLVLGALALLPRRRSRGSRRKS
ncbi:MAG: NUDIX domain-containing protein, partial [Methanobacteriota archaeon]